jgi:hypothetical protein
MDDGGGEAVCTIRLLCIAGESLLFQMMTALKPHLCGFAIGQYISSTAGNFTHQLRQSISWLVGDSILRLISLGHAFPVAGLDSISRVKSMAFIIHM